MSQDHSVSGAAPLRRAREARGDFAVIADLLPYLRPFLGRILLALGLVFVAKLCNLLVPVVLKRIVDGLNVEPSLPMLPVGLLLAYGTSRIGVSCSRNCVRWCSPGSWRGLRGRSLSRCSVICTGSV